MFAKQLVRLNAKTRCDKCMFWMGVPNVACKDHGFVITNSLRRQCSLRATVSVGPSVDAQYECRWLDGQSRRALSRHQLEIARLLADGQTRADVAEYLGISEHTVKAAIKVIYQRLGVNNRAGLVHALLQ
jgi:DNA-binding CsgD family transcriptional regulator